MPSPSQVRSCSRTYEGKMRLPLLSKDPKAFQAEAEIDNSFLYCLKFRARMRHSAWQGREGGGANTPCLGEGCQPSVPQGRGATHQQQQQRKFTPGEDGWLHLQQECCKEYYILVHLRSFVWLEMLPKSSRPHSTTLIYIHKIQ